MTDKKEFDRKEDELKELAKQPGIKNKKSKKKKE